MDNLRKPSLWLGALVGLLLTTTLTSLLFLADQVAGLPFIPFDVFDYVSRILPGALLTFGIDMMVEMIIAFNLGETSVAAKSAEQLMGLGAFLALGTAAITVVYGLMNRSKTQARNLVPGLVLGLALGAVMMLISSQVNLTATAPLPAQIIWVVLTFAIWGMAANWIYNDLAHSEGKTKTDEETGETVTVEPLNRRQFMVRVGGASAVLTVIGAGLGALVGGRPGEGAVVSEIPADAATDGAGNVLPNAADTMEPAPGTRPNIRRWMITIASTSVRARRSSIPMSGGSRSRAWSIIRSVCLCKTCTTSSTASTASSPCLASAIASAAR